MTAFERRLQAVESAGCPPPTPAVTFIPIGVAWTPAEGAYIAAERVRLGVPPGGRLLAFKWQDAEP